MVTYMIIWSLTSLALASYAHLRKRGGAVGGILEGSKRRGYERSLLQYRGNNTPIDTYNQKDKVGLSDYFFDDPTASMENRHHNRMCYLVQQASIGRSQHILNME
ncbi:hypothetical protein DFS34DRAFT_590456 [Phlyctochytrium arcticum]|nr:hypothetical protein DFS34DRAFT_598302 [Phlyctochytrium arcticum]KAI9104035.1 hypothetical protein DFS34DRAFT_590456 [Phlyctochytrium arcticum]